ncbi:3-deoxy-7-phosphoheptulonate synthase [Pelagibaculum spongiae]|uniref:Phospho-2-dehydro-3-deoxyheptonate aldolase n=1 Tax=Pelagibaculum spongiae TaxID=2080658 RepID=A0A2V1GY80_9GAMM|nr:3-deoxy-7-phosphoheptulonate synthase [Pelagibaculum spongiae]PVZ69595.1 3-deoxy-7-phosphoheptulonate synthase [Pelagibaculum spongiae]
MSENEIHNVNVISQDVLITPRELKARLPVSDSAEKTILSGRKVVEDILDGKDHRLIVVVGPCSIHDVKAAKAYAEKLAELSKKVGDTLYLVMRVYFEKPRTTVGWKGLINDPRMDDSFHIEEGLEVARELLLWINELGLPAATEALDPISPQYLSDLISWSAIGARTTESQTHREMSSGLSMPVGFKNGTDGGLEVAINAMQSVSQPHSFLGINRQGQCVVIRTRGNKYGHVVLRGGKQPNYDSVNIALCEKRLEAVGERSNIIVDCSHANSNKDPSLQPLVADNIANQVLEGNQSIVGMMLESNIEAGNQKIPANLEDLKYGVSVTDGCIDWQTTEKTLIDMADKLRETLPKRLSSK